MQALMWHYICRSAAGKGSNQAEVCCIAADGVMLQRRYTYLFLSILVRSIVCMH